MCVNNQAVTQLFLHKIKLLMQFVNSTHLADRIIRKEFKSFAMALLFIVRNSTWSFYWSPSIIQLV